MKKYVIQERKTGTVLEECDSFACAKFVISGYEDIDKNDGIFNESSYKIVEVDENEADVMKDVDEEMDFKEAYV